MFRLSEELADLIWNLFDKLDWKARKTIGYQMIRSADSVSANLAEGFGRYTYADRRRFYRYARGSFEETKTWLEKASRRSLLSEKEEAEFRRIVNELGPKLNGFINKTR